jgi:hypothetical protein
MPTLTHTHPRTRTRPRTHPGRRYQNSNYLYRMTTLLAISVLASAVGPEVTMQMLPTVLQVTTPTTLL